MCSFEGTKEEIDESCSNKELVEINEEEAFTSGREIEESIHEEHEENHLCLVRHEQEVSNSNSNNGVNFHLKSCKMHFMNCMRSMRK